MLWGGSSERASEHVAGMGLGSWGEVVGRVNMVWWVWGASHTVDLTHVDDLLKSWKQTTSKSQYMLAGWATMEDDG